MFSNAYPGDEIFQKRLDALGITMSVYEIKMYIAGLLLGPENVPLSFLLDEILLTDTEDEVVFDDLESSQSFINFVTALWNQIAGYAGSPERYPKLPPLRKSFADKQDKIDYINKEGDLLCFFYQGLDESEARSLFDQCFELITADMGIAMMYDLFTDFHCDYDDGVEITNKDIDEMLMVVEDFHERWPKTYSKLNHLLTGIRTGKIELDSEEEMERKFNEFKESIENQ